MNSVANGKITRETPFENVHIPVRSMNVSLVPAWSYEDGLIAIGMPERPWLGHPILIPFA